MIRFGDVLGDKWKAVAGHLTGMFALAVFLKGIGTGNNEILLIIAVWILTGTGSLFFVYRIKRKYFGELEALCQSLDKKYLLSEVMERQNSLDGRRYHALMRRANKAMVEEVTLTEMKQQEYEEYIEQWIHEIKIPIASAGLICENEKDDKSRRIMMQLERINHEVEKALYFARAGNVEQDYLVKETGLQEIVEEAITNNKQLFIQNRMQIECGELKFQVFTDGKWIGFILSQIFVNSIKYKSEHPVIRIRAEELEQGVRLEISDNGIGIKESELPRIFKKGFTGTNGRREQTSTGIGLYLCKKLCDKLGIGITAQSEAGCYTKIQLVFPKGSYLSKMQD